MEGKKYKCAKCGYTYDPEVGDALILCMFILQIVIHERAKMHSITSPQQIGICFRFIGNIFSADQSEITASKERISREG